MDKSVLAIDPGHAKCGMAVVRRDEQGELHLDWMAVVPPEELAAKIHEAFAAKPFSMAIVGSGTHSRPIIATIREELPSMGTLVVDEKDTSLQARERYWEFNPRRGWRRLLPASLQVPPEPVDAYVAFILAERVLLER